MRRGRIPQGVPQLIWMIGFCVLLSYAMSTTEGDRHLPTGLGLVALVAAGGWTLWIFRG